MKILLLEDRNDDAEIIQKELELAGLAFTCVRAKTKDAYIQNLADDIDIILADYNLPNFTALQALDILKANSNLNIPFIIVSGAISEEIAVECMKHGATDYLLKDRLTRLGHAVRQAYNEKQLRAESFRLEQSEREQRELALALLETVRTLSTSLDIDTVMNAILINVGRVVPHDAANIMLIEGDHTRCAYWRGYNQQNVDTLTSNYFSIDHPIYQKIFATGLPYLTSDTTKNLTWIPIEGFDWVQSNIATPIDVQGNIIGFLNIDSGKIDAFTQTHVEWMMAFASEVAIAVENAKLYEQVRLHAEELEQRVEERTKELLTVKQSVEAILNSTSDAIVIVRPDYTIEQVNPAFLEMMNVSNPVECSIEDFCDADNLDSWIRAIGSVKHYASSQHIDLVIQPIFGTPLDVEIALSSMTDDSDSLIVCSLRDISRRKRTEKELQKAAEQERELRELKSRFVAIVSHEFRNPLGVIQMSASTVHKYLPRLTDAQRERHFQTIYRQVEQMTNMLEDVLAIETTESGTAELNKMPTDLIEFIEQIIEEFRHNTGENHTLQFLYDGIELNSVYIDQKLIRQMFVNLLGNAIKYSPDGSTVLVELDSDPDIVTLKIHDSGIGIPLKYQENMFQPFNRAGNTGNIPGTGLGLVIVRNAVESHGGKIECKSTEGIGTTFVVTLPLTKVGVA